MARYTSNLRFRPVQAIATAVFSGLVLFAGTPIQQAAANPIAPDQLISNRGLAQNPPQLAIDRAFQRVSKRSGVAVEDLQLQRYSRETWSDGCLGLGKPVELCMMGLVEGWQIEIVDGQRSWFFRTDLSGERVRRVKSNSPEVLPPSVRDRVFQSASEQFDIPVDRLQVVEAEPRIWNGCLGIDPGDGMACTEIGIFGWRVAIEGDQQTWVYHTNQDGSDVRLNPAPEMNQ